MATIIDKLKSHYYHKRDIYHGKKRLRYLEKAKLEYGLSDRASGTEQYIVSMASYAERYKVLPMALKSLLHQSMKPDKIIVWLDEDTEENSLTEELTEFCKYGVEFCHTSDGIKPHKKYLYAMKRYPQANIITVDDDLIYSEDMVESLIKAHQKFPYCVCARRVHRITFAKTGAINPYMDWKYEDRESAEPSLLLCATGGGGVLYPSGRSMPVETFDVPLIKELSLEADDIWLKVMELRNKISVVWVKNRYVMPYEVENSQNTSLNSSNVWEGKNDLFIQKLLDRYPETYANLMDAGNV